MLDTSLYPWLEMTILSNTLYDYIVAFCVFLGAFILFRILERVILSKLASLADRTVTDIDDTFISIVQSLRPPFYLFVAVYVAFRFIQLPESFDQILTLVLVIWVVYQAIVAVQILLDYIFDRTFNKEGDDSARTAMDFIKNIAKGVLWGVGLLLILSNFGIDVTSLIAGLGIGGIAIALAAQNILGDLFSSFAIVFDKPFKIGDYIVVGEHSGTVQKIGIKTTRIKALQGEEIVISNQELTSARVQNFKRMEKRRIAFSIGVTYDTTQDQLTHIPSVIEEIISRNEEADFDRSHFKSFDDSALTFETVYYVNQSDYSIYMDAQQEINLAIKEAFDSKGIEMAFPTQTIYIQKD